MPTGYTAKLMEEGQSFNDFVMLCARNFGATITMRDDPLEARIPDEFKPSDYHLKEITSARKALDRLRAMSPKEQVAFGRRKRAKDIRHYREYIASEAAQNERLSQMEIAVRAWKPPTTDHRGLKDFMLQQIETSRNDDGYWLKQLAAAEKREPASYYADAIANAERNIVYGTREHEKEVERAENRTAWVRALRNSLLSKAAR